MIGKMIVIKALKYPNRPHYEYPAKVLALSDDHVLVRADSGRTLTHHTRGKKFVFDMPSIELLSRKEWFTVAMECQGNNCYSFYCNIAQPAIFKDATISFVDFDLDLVKNKGGAWTIVDQDEFELHRKQLEYPDNIVKRVPIEIIKLKKRAEQNLFPFDGYLKQFE